MPNHRTVAGLVLDTLGPIPEKGDTLRAHGATFTITAVNDRAILQVRIRRDPQPDDSSPEAEIDAG